MASLEYRGKALASPADLAYKSYVESIKEDDLTYSEVDAAITSGLSGYVTKDYVDSRDALLATQSYIDAQDNLRLKLADKGNPNGPVPLDNTGRVSSTYLNLPSTQKWNVGPSFPSSYNSLASATTSEITLYTMTFPDPGYPYKLVAFGQEDVATTCDLTYPICNVRVGNGTSGQIIAQGRTGSDLYGGIVNSFSDDFNRANNTTIGSDWSVTYSGPDIGTYLSIVESSEAWLVPSTWTGPAGSSSVTGSPGASRQARALNVNPDTRYTLTDYQRVQATVGIHDQVYGVYTDTKATHYLYMRVSDDFTQYVAWRLTYGSNWNGSYDANTYTDASYNWYVFDEAAGAIDLVYANGGAETVLDHYAMGLVNSGSPGGGTKITAYAGDPIGNDPYTFSLVGPNGNIRTVTDTLHVTPRGATNRGWGFGMGMAGGNATYSSWYQGYYHPALSYRSDLPQKSPPSFTSISVSDIQHSYEPAHIVPKDLDTMTTLTGPTPLYITLSRAGAATIPGGVHTDRDPSTGMVQFYTNADYPNTSVWWPDWVSYPGNVSGTPPFIPTATTVRAGAYNPTLSVMAVPA